MTLSLKNIICLNKLFVINFHSTALHKAIRSNNTGIFSVLLKEPSLDLDLQNVDGLTALWLALSSSVTSPSGTDLETDDVNAVNTFANQLVSKGCSVDSCNEETGPKFIFLIF